MATSRKTLFERSNKSAFQWLADEGEATRRLYLRSHLEAGIDSSDEILLRRTLDDELGAIAGMELRFEVGIETEGQAKHQLEGIPGFLSLIEGSPAFAQYLNSYLYFGVRFAAGRLNVPAPTGKYNESGPGLPPPPHLGAKKAPTTAFEDLSRPMSSPDIDEALDFLDDYVYPEAGDERNEAGGSDRSERIEMDAAAEFELWLRGLLPFSPASRRFHRIAKGLYEWAVQRYEFYVDLERVPDRVAFVERWRSRKDLVEGEWHARNPLAARCGVTDLFWLAKILRADITPRGIVRYQSHSWLRRLRDLDPEKYPKDQILRIEEVLRAVFDFACDMIQNAVEISERAANQIAHPDDYPERLSGSVDWRPAQDQEIEEIRKQRSERMYTEGRSQNPVPFPGTALDPNEEQGPSASPVETGEPGTSQPPTGPDTKAGAIARIIARAIAIARVKARAIAGAIKGAAARAKSPSCRPPDAPYWSRRVLTGEYEENLIGVALSGGGIRSATFALGVLQRLKELDLLRRVDFLSTVSGGGYIGGWLAGNVWRTRYWLSRTTSWDESICHLRDYSKYLAPQSGLLNADSWVIWGTWIRNATLIQFTAVAWLSGLFTLAIAGKALFESVGMPGMEDIAVKGLTAGLVLLALILVVNLIQVKPGLPTQNTFMVLLAWIGAFVTAALLWSRSCGRMDYSDILRCDYKNWPSSLRVVLGIVLLVLALVSVFPVDSWSSRALRILGALFQAGLSLGVLYLALCAVRYLFGILLVKHPHAEAVWWAYVFGPALVMLAVTLALVVFIGLIGRSSPDWRREWWTRYGSWLAIYGVAFLVLGLVAVFGTAWIHAAFRYGKTVRWGAVAGWVASAVAGLLAGNSNRTKGNGQSSSVAMEWVARIGGVLFIVGAVVGLSALLHLVLVNVWLPTQQHYWWQDLNMLLSADPARTIVSYASRANGPMLLSLALLVACGMIFSWRFNLNTFGLNQFYRNRLVRCYLGATRWRPGLRNPDHFTAFDDNDDLEIAELRWREEDRLRGDQPFRGPFPIINCALNLGGSSDLSVKTRQSASFTMTPLRCGSDRAKMGYARVEKGNGFAGGVLLGQAISISGAAASPNMGYNTSPLVSLLLTIFNVRLAWWFPNPGNRWWDWNIPPTAAGYLVKEILGLAGEDSDFVNVSDGGHFENLAIYELIRRRTKVIIASDAECDSDLAFGSLGNVIRICETDFGAKIDIDVTSIRKQENGVSRAHCAVGRITYSNGSLGYLIYLKSSMTGDEDAAVQQYRAQHPDFPHQSTGDQFFTEDQFESYRRLGHHVTTLAFRSVYSESNLVDIASKLYDMWTPSGFSNDVFFKHTEALDELWERFRTSVELRALLEELLTNQPMPPLVGALSDQERCACLELTQLMENVVLNLRLDDFWDHPDNRGWAMLFIMWAKSPRFRAAWDQTRHTFGIRFEYFCESRLGMKADHPVVRV